MAADMGGKVDDDIFIFYNFFTSRNITQIIFMMQRHGNITPGNPSFDEPINQMLTQKSGPTGYQDFFVFEIDVHGLRDSKFNASGKWSETSSGIALKDCI